MIEVAERQGQKEALKKALQGSIRIASIGPVTNERLAAYDLKADVVPLHPKLGALVMALKAAYSSSA